MKFLNYEGLQTFLNNLKGFFVDKSTNQEISGDKTFTGTVIVPTPTDGDGGSADGVAANKGYVNSKIAENDAMAYKGTLNQSSDLPTKSNTTNKIKVGATYKVATAGTYAGQAAKVGDLFIAQAINSSTKDITWDYIPAGDETETSVRVSDGTTSVTINTTSQVGPDITFGQAAAKQVDTSITAGSTSTNVPTSGAVTAYALKDVTAGSGIEVGTKANGTQSVAVSLEDNGGSGATLKFTNTGELTVRYGSGLTKNNSGLNINKGLGIDFGNNGELTVNAGDGITFGNDGELKVQAKPTNSCLTVDGSGIRVVANTNQGIEVTSAGIGIGLSGSGNTSDVDFENASGLAFDSNGKLRINAGSGLHIDDNGVLKANIGSGYLEFGGVNGTFDVNIDNIGTSLEGNGLTYSLISSKMAVNVDSNNANGLSVGANGLALATAVASTSGTGGSAGAMSAQDKEKLDNLDNTAASKLEATSTAGAVALELQNSDSTLDKVNISSTDNALSIAASASASPSTDTNLTFTVNAKANNGIKIGNNGIELDVDTAAGLTETASGNKLAVNAGDGIKFNSTTGAIEVDFGAGLTLDGTTPNQTINVKGDTSKGILVDTTNGVGINNGNGIEFSSGTVAVKAYDGITVNSNGVSADIDTTKGLEFTGSTAGSKQIGINNGNGITFTNGAIEAKIDSTNNTGGLDFDANGNIEVVSITDAEINALFA